MTNETPTGPMAANDAIQPPTEPVRGVGAYPTDTLSSGGLSGGLSGSPLIADLRRFNEAAKPLHDAMVQAYIRASYVSAAMFADLLAGRPTREVGDYLAAGGFKMEARRG